MCERVFIIRIAVAVENCFTNFVTLNLCFCHSMDANVSTGNVVNLRVACRKI